MSALPKKKWTEAEYLAFERASDIKHEFYRGEIFAMAGATEDHITIVGNIGASFHAQLRQRPCKYYATDMRLKVSPTGLYTYPDIVVVCGERKFVDNKRDMLLNATLIVEVLSTSTEGYDRGDKFQSYQTIDSLKEYMLVSQKKPLIERYLRQDDDTWVLTNASGLEAKIELPSIQCTLALAEVYEQIDFAESSGDETERHL